MISGKFYPCTDGAAFAALTKSGACIVWGNPDSGPLAVFRFLD